MKWLSSLHPDHPKNQWHSHFAWQPVYSYQEQTWFWLEYVARRWQRGYYEYKGQIILPVRACDGCGIETSIDDLDDVDWRDGTICVQCRKEAFS